MSREQEVQKMILKYGKVEDVRPKSAWVVCQGCGKKIFSNITDLHDVGFSETKRKTCQFWHEGCYEKVWDSPIRWLRG